MTQSLNYCLERYAKIKVALVISFLALPLAASANIIWPSIFIVQQYYVWYVILAGLMIEIVAARIFLETGDIGNDHSKRNICRDRIGTHPVQRDYCRNTTTPHWRRNIRFTPLDSRLSVFCINQHVFIRAVT